MPDITKLTKAQLIDIIEQSEENKYDNFKVEFGLTYSTDKEWIDHFKSITDNRDEWYKNKLKEHTIAVQNGKCFSG